MRLENVQAAADIASRLARLRAVREGVKTGAVLMLNMYTEGRGREPSERFRIEPAEAVQFLADVEANMVAELKALDVHE